MFGKGKGKKNAAIQPQGNLRARPNYPKVGDVWDQPIDEILTSWNSTDGAKAGKWEATLKDKRRDSHYKEVVESIQKHGFVRPLTTWERDDSPSGFNFGDGHHRLAAAIDLGLTHIPVQLVKGPWGYGEGELSGIGQDSGQWRKGRPIPTSNQRQYN